MKMKTVRKATEDEKKKYSEAVTRCYPLYGFVEMKNESGEKFTCEVEFLGGAWGKRDPQYEIMLPAGYTADGGLHSMLCYDLADLRDRSYSVLEKCECDGGCASFWETVKATRGNK